LEVVEDLCVVAYMEEAELDWEEVASVAVEVNQILAVQAVVAPLGEDMAVVGLEAAWDLVAVDLEEVVMEALGQVDSAMLDSEVEAEVRRRVQPLARVKAARA
jgi:hypothetical protein